MRLRAEKESPSLDRSLVLVGDVRSDLVGDVQPWRQAPVPVPAPPASAAPPEDGQWTMPAKNYAITRYSELAEINTENVKNLQVAFTFSTGVNRGQEAAPLVVGSHDVRGHALSQHPLRARPDEAGRADEMEVRAEARRGRAGRRLLRRGQSRADLRRRQGLLQHARRATSVAVDADTGEEVWKTKLGDINLGETMTMAPLVVKDKVLVGNSGGEYGVRGWLQALDVNSGKMRLERLQHRARPGRADRRRASSPSTTATRARTSASRPGRRTPGSRAAARSGAGSPTIPT